MSDFQAGWYAIKRNYNGSRLCLYFRSNDRYTARCTVEANGQQMLLWQDPAGVDGPGRPAQWLPSYERAPNAASGDRWDNPRGTAPYRPDTPGDFSRTARKPTAKELLQRARAVDAAQASGLNCTKEIHVGIFFDGTNNNMERDRPEKGHTNVVSLFDAHKEDKSEFFRYYIPGVGTRFAEIGEESESNADGNTFAVGGEARIHFGMLQVLNAVCSAATGFDLLTKEEVKTLITSAFNGLRTSWRLSDSRMVGKFQELDARLRKAVEGKRPKVTRVNVSVIGFSRGAAEARTFTHWLRSATGASVGGAACHLRFLGIFDTVASVALADSSPVVGRGFMDWADGTMGISGVERTVHFVAAHEIRRSFPLSTARAGGVWPIGVKEFVYPGAHSDVGGGYAPREQGKGVEGRAALLSQIPLNDMYHEAMNAAVKLLPLTDIEPLVRADFAIDPALDQSFRSYAAWTRVDEKQNVAAAPGTLEDRLHSHTRLYWRWRAHVSANAKFTALHSYGQANAQDRTDLWEAELDWRRDVEKARAAATPIHRHVFTTTGPVPSPMPSIQASEEQKSILKEVAEAERIPAPVSDFFDRYVHDSHAGFWLLGPRTRLEKSALIREIKDRQATQKRLAALAAAASDPETAFVLEREASFFELNQFERRVLAADAASPGSLPVLTDADAAALRARAGVLTTVVLRLMGTATRREAAGHGRYRRVFDQS